MHFWEFDLVDVRALGKFNDRYVYILSAIYVFSKFLHKVSLRSKTGNAVTSASQAIFKDPRYIRLIKLSAIACINISPIKIRIDISRFYPNLSQLTMTRFTPPRAWCSPEWQIRILSPYGREWTKIGFEFVSFVRNSAPGNTCASVRKRWSLLMAACRISAQRYFGLRR